MNTSHLQPPEMQQTSNTSHTTPSLSVSTANTTHAVDVHPYRRDSQDLEDHAPASPKSKQGSTPHLPEPAPPAGVKQILSMVIPAGISLLLIFWITSLHLYGALFRQGRYVKRVHVPVVDFDGGAMGQALLQSAASLSGTYGVPTYQVLPPETTTPEQLRQDVYKGKYWAALYVEAASTQRWEQAINGTSADFSPSDTVKYILNDARYYTFYQQPFLSTSMNVVNSAAALFSQQTAVPRLAATTGALSSTQAAALFNPIRPTEINANKAGVYSDVYDKVFYNTVGTVLPILLQFFFLMALNGISQGSKIYDHWSTGSIYKLRHTARFVWPLFTSLSSVGWSYAMKGDGYALHGKWFVLWWLVTYGFCLISYNILDAATTYIPMPFMSQFVLPWIILSVSSTICSPEILHPWFRVNYFFPAHHWWELTLMILTEGGLTRHLRYALPVFLVWFVASFVMAFVAVRDRIRKERQASAEGAQGGH